MPLLRILSGSKAGQCRAIQSTPVTIGGASGNVLQMDDESVSGSHAVIELTPDGPLLRDLGSTNGTFINGEPVTAALLKPGDVVNFGGVEATLEQPAAAAAPAVKVSAPAVKVSAPAVKVSAPAVKVTAPAAKVSPGPRAQPAGPIVRVGAAQGVPVKPPGQMNVRSAPLVVEKKPSFLFAILLLIAAGAAGYFVYAKVKQNLAAPPVSASASPSPTLVAPQPLPLATPPPTAAAPQPAAPPAATPYADTAADTPTPAPASVPDFVPPPMRPAPPVAAASLSNRVFLAGPGTLLSVLGLSDGTVLAAGAADDLKWLPPGTTVIDLPDKAANGWPLPDATGANATRRGVILHLSADLSRILAVAAFPAGKGGAIAAIKSDVPPGYETRGIYIAGSPADGTIYWLGKLDANFLSGNPKALAWGYDKETRDTSRIHLDTIWDVGGDGRIIFYAYWGTDWGIVCRLRADGAGLADVPQWPSTHDTKGPDGSQVHVLSLKPGNNDLRSKTWADFNKLMDDGYGRIRKGSQPLDVFYAEPIEAGDRELGYTGYRARGSTATTAAIAIDRRTNDFFLGANVQSILPPWNDIPNAPDFEPYVIAYTKDGQMRWWSRMYSETLGDGGPFVSSDMGKTWKPYPAGTLFGAATSAVACGSTLFVVDRSVGLLESVNGAPWTPLDQAVSGNDIGSMASLDGKKIFLGLKRGMISMSDDGGKTWQPPVPVAPSTRKGVAVLQIIAGQPQRILAGINETGFFASNDGGAHWAAVAGPPKDQHYRHILADPATAGMLYLVCDSAVYRSTDAGEHWTDIGLTATGRKFTCIAVDPANPSTLYVSSFGDEPGVSVSTDAGKSWKGENVGNTTGQYVFCVPGPGKTEVFYASADRLLYRRGKSGKNDWTWLHDAAGLAKAPETFMRFISDPQNPGSIIAFTCGAGTTSSPDQYVDGVAIDYTQSAADGDVVVLARSHGNNVSNYWSGLAGKSFMSRQMGNVGNDHYQWIGRLRAATGKFVNATWFAGLDPFSNNFGAPYKDPNLAGWPDHNGGNPNLKSAHGHSMGVAPDGSIYIAGTSRGAITTRNAFQPMTSPLAGKSPWYDFIRIHSPDLSTVTYATALTGQGWDPHTGSGGGNTAIGELTPLAGGGYAVVGSHDGTGNTIPTANIPPWGKSAPQGETMMLGLFNTR